MSNTRFGLLLYLLLLTCLAVIGVVRGLGGDLIDLLRLEESVVVALLCGGGLYAAAGLLARRDLVPFAGLVVAIEPIAFVLAVHEIWRGNETLNSTRWPATLLVIAISGLIVAALRLMTGPADLAVRWAFLLTALCQAGAAAVVIRVIWDFPSDWGGGEVKTATTLLVLATFGFLFTPVLERLRRTEDGPAEAGPSTTI